MKLLRLIKTLYNQNITSAYDLYSNCHSDVILLIHYHFMTERGILVMLKLNYKHVTSLALVCTLVTGAEEARAADDKSTASAVSDMLGFTHDEGIDKINYNERARLVMPPNSLTLPAPRQSSPPPEGWPQDASHENRRTDRFARAPGAEPEKPKPGFMERVRGPAATTSPGTDDEPGLLQKIITNKQRAAELETDEPQRQLLVEPPDGYRHPSKPLKEVKDTSKKNGFLGKLFGGEGNESDPVAQTAGVNEPIKQPLAESADSNQGSSLSTIKGLLPGFLKN